MPVIRNDRKSYNIDYQDALRDCRGGDPGFNFAGLPRMYADGYQAGKAAYRAAQNKITTKDFLPRCTF